MCLGLVVWLCCVMWVLWKVILCRGWLVGRIMWLCWLSRLCNL